MSTYTTTSVVTTETIPTSIPTPDHKLIGVFHDAEMSGNNPMIHFLVSWGVAVYDLVTRVCLGTHLVKFNNPYSLSLPETGEPSSGNKRLRIGWEARCLDEFWLKAETDKNPDAFKDPLVMEYEACNSGGIDRMTRRDGIEDMQNWIIGMFKEHANGSHQRIVNITDTCNDVYWLSYNLQREGFNGLCHMYGGLFRDVINISSVQLGFLHDKHGIPLSISEKQHFSENKMVREAFNIPDEHQPMTKADHNPVNDCLNMAEQFFLHAGYIHMYETEVERMFVNSREMYNYMANQSKECDLLMGIFKANHTVTSLCKNRGVCCVLCNEKKYDDDVYGSDSDLLDDDQSMLGDEEPCTPEPTDQDDSTEQPLVQSRPDTPRNM